MRTRSQCFQMREVEGSHATTVAGQVTCLLAAACHSCGKKGHIASACHSNPKAPAAKSQKSKDNGPGKTAKTNFVETPEELHLFALGEQRKSKPLHAVQSAH